MRHSTLIGFTALLALALAGAIALAVVGHQHDGEAASSEGFSGTGIAGYTLSGTVGGPLLPTTPVDIAIDDTGRIFVADISLNRVLAFTPAGNLDTSWGEEGMSATLAFPAGLALGPDGSLYVLQLGNAEVHILNGDGNERDSWSVSENRDFDGLGVPVAIAVDQQGVVYIPDQRSQEIRRYATNGDELEVWGFPLGEIGVDQIWPRDIVELNGQMILSYSSPSGGGGGLLAFEQDGTASLLPDVLTETGSRVPSSLAVSPTGEVTVLYISDDEGTPPLIARGDTSWAPEGIETLTAINGLIVPGIAHDAAGKLFIADPSHQRLRIYNADGSVAGDIRSPDDKRLLAGIDEILVGPDGLLYVADPLLGRVLAYQSDGSVLTTFQLPDDPAAPLTTGFTRQRMRIAVDRSGSVYVVDEFTGRITKFRQDGEVIDTDWAASDDPEHPVVAIMLAAGAEDRLYLVDLEFQDRVRVFNEQGEDLGVLVDPSWEGAIQDVAVFDEKVYTVELGIGSSPIRSFTTGGKYIDQLADLSHGNGNGNRTGFALAVAPDGDLLIGAVNVNSGPEFEYQLLRLDSAGHLRRIGTLPVPFTTLPDIAASPTGTLYIAAPNDQRIYVYEPVQ